MNSNYKVVRHLVEKLLGRKSNKSEEIAWSIVIGTKGVEGLVDVLLDSQEYLDAFGYDTVPFQCCRPRSHPLQRQPPLRRVLPNPGLPPDRLHGRSKALPAREDPSTIILGQRPRRPPAPTCHVTRSLQHRPLNHGWSTQKSGARLRFFCVTDCDPRVTTNHQHPLTRRRGMSESQHNDPGKRSFGRVPNPHLSARLTLVNFGRSPDLGVPLYSRKSKETLVDEVAQRQQRGGDLAIEASPGGPETRRAAP